MRILKQTTMTVLAAVAVIACTAGPALAAGPAAEQTTPASAIGLHIGVAKDGNGPFTPDDVPGGDTGDANGIVRTLDAITYRVSMNTSGGRRTNERFTLTAPAGTSWTLVPGACTGPGTGIQGQELHCNLGTIGEGQVIAVSALLQVSGDLRNGDHIVVQGVGTADGLDGEPVGASSPVTTVSAAPRYNLSKNAQGSVLRTHVPGPDGEDGIQLVYPIAVDWQPVVPGQGLLGFERAAAPMTFTDDVSQILGDLPANARLWGGEHPACAPLDSSVTWFRGLPAGKGGGAKAVADSGTITCTQSAPGANVDVTITDTVTDAAAMPTRNQSGGPISGGRGGYVVAGYMSFWMPTPPKDTSVDSVNTYSPLQTTSISGLANFAGADEPTADNRAARNLVELANGSGAKVLKRLATDGTLLAGSAKDGDPWATQGDRVRSTVSAQNRGLSSFTNAVLCDTFDRATQRLTRTGRAGSPAAVVGGMTDGTVQYAAYDMASPAEGQHRDCGDENGPWYDQPEDVPGGIDAVGAVRATGGIQGGTSASLSTVQILRKAPDGTRVYDFGHLWFGDRRPGWVHDSADPVLGAGGLADSVLLTQNLARITKKVVGAGKDGDAIRYAAPGDQLDFVLQPSFTNGTTTGGPAAVTVRDVLPLHTTYVPGSSAVAPTIDTVSDDGGREHQRLTWVLGDVQPNARIAPIRYSVTVARTAPSGSITNEASIESPTDQSPAQWRHAQRAVQVIAASGLAAEVSALAPVVVVGDRLEWQLRYANTDASTIGAVDLIDVLPFRRSASDATFHGSVALAEHLRPDAAARESVTYTRAAPGAIALDGADPSNRQGGSTKWCAETAFGSDGCPASLADVTAFRIQRSAPVPAGATVDRTIALVTDGARDRDTLTNRFGVRTPKLALPALSNSASVRVAAGSIGDHVWTDSDGDGLQGADEPGLASVAVHLRGTDDQGATVERDTTSDSGGDYRFDDLRPGEYVVQFTAPGGRAFTKPLVGDDRATDSDAQADGSTAPVVITKTSIPGGALGGVKRDGTVDAGVLPEDDSDGSDDPDGDGSDDSGDSGGSDDSGDSDDSGGDSGDSDGSDDSGDSDGSDDSGDSDGSDDSGDSGDSGDSDGSGDSDDSDGSGDSGDPDDGSDVSPQPSADPTAGPRPSDPGAGGSGAGSANSPRGSTANELAFTGAAIGPASAIAVLLVAIGLVLRSVSRRRRQS